MLLSFLLTALATPMPLAMATNPSYNPNNARLQMGHRSSPDLPRAAASELEPRKASRSRENVLNNMMRVRGAGKLAMRERVAEQQRQIRERLAVSRPAYRQLQLQWTRLMTGRGVDKGGRTQGKTRGGRLISVKGWNVYGSIEGAGAVRSLYMK